MRRSAHAQGLIVHTGPTPQDLVSVAVGACATIAAVLFGFGGVVFGLYTQILREMSAGASTSLPALVGKLERYLSVLFVTGSVALTGALAGVAWFLWPVSALYLLTVLLTIGTFVTLPVAALVLLWRFIGIR